ncbi:MAG: PDZ domain-containing protein [Candidatus Latescibacteria bacterium]|nr:PDZ domain-containing protein [Candidatus Latescibacterota bacterium]
MSTRPLPVARRPAVLSVALGLCCILILTSEPAFGNSSAFRLIAQVRTLIHRHYVEKIDSIQVIDGAVDGIVAALPQGENIYISPSEIDQIEPGGPPTKRRLDKRAQLELLSDTFHNIRAHYLQTVSVDTLAHGAIWGMLATLDPHSQYLDPKARTDMVERYRGDFEGIGIHFDLRQGELLVIAPIVGSPSYGRLRAGDRILAIDGVSTDGITAEQVMKKLRGPKGSRVEVTVYREGFEDLLDFTLVRNRIPIVSVPYAFVLRPSTGYIRIARFAENTGRELAQALAQLRAADITRLVLDLRDNGGGLLDQAVEVADHFIDAGQLVVYTEGRHPNSRQEYRARYPLEDTPLSLIVLLNHGSASGSEIVAGAIQDLDRGLIVGQTSFGKGLVQQQFPLPNDGLLLLTIARYYTPLGRLIQRPYTRDLQAYLQEGQDDLDPNAIDSLRSQQNVYFTALGRPVYGGGGISPDEPLAIQPISAFMQQLLTADAPFNFARHWAGSRSDWPTDFAQFRTHFRVGDETLDNFRAFLAGQDVAIADEIFARHHDPIRRALKSSLALVLWGDSQSYQIRLEGNPQMEQILDLFEQADELARKAGEG